MTGTIPWEVRIEYCFRHMTSKPLAGEFLSQFGLEIKPSYSYAVIGELARRAAQKIPPEALADFCYAHYAFSNAEFHYANLRSGLLTGHSWNGARPSTLHLSLQEKVRDFIHTETPLPDLLRVGTEIMMHEYFMVATHDLLVDEFIRHFRTRTIPPSGHKSISDFMFDGVPYDLKSTTLPNGFGEDAVDAMALMNNLLFGADADRLRKQAQNSMNGWGLNRFYVVVRDQDRWLCDPGDMIREFLMKSDQLTDPYQLEFEGYRIFAQIIII